jgi:hypothetical protein
MAYGHYLFILLASVCLFGQISAESNYTSVVSPFDNKFNASNPYALELSYQFPTKHAVFYQLISNVTDATFVDLSNIAVLYTNLPPTYHNLVISSGSFNGTYTGTGTNVEVLGQVIDPCVFAAPGGTATLVLNGTTDALSGEITGVVGSYEVLSIQNATSFDYSSPAPILVTGSVNNNFQSSRFYFMDLNANGNEKFGLEVISTAGIELKIAGLGNCATWHFTDTSPFWEGTIPANQTVTTSIVAGNETSFVWVLVQGNTEASVTLTWTYLGSAPVSGTTPDQTPNANSNDLPTWATALLVVFGILIAVLVIVVIVMCVKNRQRSTYQGV